MMPSILLIILLFNSLPITVSSLKPGGIHLTGDYYGLAPTSLGQLHQLSIRTPTDYDGVSELR